MVNVPLVCAATSFPFPSISYLAFGGRLDVRVAGVADDIVDLLHWTLGNVREGRLTVVGKVTVDLPRFPEIRRPLNRNGSRSKGLRKEKNQNQCQEPGGL